MKPFNLIICGVGGQGVNLLSECIQKTALAEGKNCAGATFKGGAQRMGSIYSFVRIYPKDRPVLPPAFGKGQADMVIALETWEAVRFHAYCHHNTRFVIHTYHQPFYADRLTGHPDHSHTLEKFMQHFQQIDLQDFGQKAKDICGSDRMMNILMGAQAIAGGMMPISLSQFLNQYELRNTNTTSTNNISQHYESLKRE